MYGSVQCFYMAAVMRGKRLVGPIRLLLRFPCHHGAARLLPEAYEKLRLVCLALAV